MSERIQVKRDGEHRGRVSYVGVNAIATDEGWHIQDEWEACRQKIESRTSGGGINSLYLRDIATETFPSRGAAIRWLIEEDTV